MTIIIIKGRPMRLLTISLGVEILGVLEFFQGILGGMEGYAIPVGPIYIFSWNFYGKKRRCL